MITFILARHGPNFNPSDVTLRMGCRTDWPLSSTGRDRADELGRTLNARGFTPPDAILVSPLIRTQETATRALNAANVANPPALDILPEFNEIDYGVDDGKPEDDLVARIGKPAIDAWERDSIMPDEWSPKPDVIAANLRAVFARLAHGHDTTPKSIIWGFSSGGIIRFLGDPRLADIITWACPRPDKVKISPAHFVHLEYDGRKWQVKGWNIKPG
jgi:broad specificity phosphatase PhoE